MAPGRYDVRKVACGLPRAARVRKRREFRAIQSDGRRIRTSGFVLIIQARTPAELEASGSARLGITASRRVGNAVVRNRAKRLVREAFRHTRGLWPKDIDLVVIVRHSTGPRRLASIVAEWTAVEGRIAGQIERARKDREDQHSSLADRPQTGQTPAPTS